MIKILEAAFSPVSLQTIGEEVFYRCFELVPSYIDVSDDNEKDVTSEVISYLRLQSIAALKKMLAERDAE